MKFWKRFISIFLCIALLTSVFSACSSLNLKASDKYLTKAEWFEMLGKTFGLGEKSEATAKEYIEYCKDWDILPKDENIKVKEKIDREYALATSVFALGKKVTGLERNSTTIRDAANYAVDKNIGKSKSWLYLHEGLIEDEAISILYNTSKVYSERKFETYDKSKYKDGVKRQKDLSGYRIDSVDNKVIIDKNTNEYSIGDVVVFGEGADAKALKIVDSENKEGKTILSTQQPEPAEICDSINMSGYGTVQDASDIKTAEGVSLVSFNGQKQLSSFETPEVAPLGQSRGITSEDIAKHNASDEYKTSDLEFKVSLSRGKISGSVEKGNFKGSAENKFKKLDQNGKEIDADVIEKWSSDGDVYKGGYKITGSVKLDDLLVAASINYNTIDGWFFGTFDTGMLDLINPADSFDVNIDSKITKSLSVEGYIKEDITLADIPIQAGPITINIKVKLCASINGKIQVKVVYYNTTSITWEAGSGLKRTSHTDEEKDFSIEVKIELGFKMEIGIGALGLSLIDVDFSIGLEFTIKFEMNELVLADEGLYLHGGDEQYLTNAKDVLLLCYEGKLIFPVIKIAINTGDSLLAKIDKALKNVKISAEWEIVGGDKAAVKGGELKVHYEHGKGFVDKCLKDELKQYDKDGDDDNDDTDDNQDDSDNNDISGITGLQIDTYAIDINTGETGTIGINSLPQDCTIDDITAVSLDESIAVVSGINSDSISVSGVSEGTTTITVRCDKSNEEIQCVVMVSEQ